MPPLNIKFGGGDYFIKDLLSRVGCTKLALLIQPMYCAIRMR
jgi:hypothetical protein